MRHLTIDVSNYDSRLHIGKQGENLTREITFDCAAWLDGLTGGVLSIVHQRPSDPDAYPCGDYVTDDTSLTWSINETDVAFSGLGKCELRYTIGSRIAKTKTFYTEIVNALNPLDTPPEAWEPYIDRVIDAATQEMENMTVSASATSGEQTSVSVTKTRENDHENIAFIFTVEKGDKGEKGEDGKSIVNVTAAIDANVGTPSVTVTTSSSDAGLSVDLDFHNMKGIPGASFDTSYLPSDTASGDSATFPDGAKNVPVDELVTTIVPQQDLHGYSKPWPAGGGKNKYPCLISDDVFNNTGGATHSKSDGKLTIVTSASSASSGVYVDSNSKVYETVNKYNTPLTISADIVASASGDVKVVFCNQTDTFTIGTTKQRISVTATTKTNIRLNIYGVNNGATLVVDNVQIEEGSSATSFEPSANICPITGFTQAEITHNSDTDTIPFGQTVYGGELNVTTGVLTIDRKYVKFDGTEAGNTFTFAAGSGVNRIAYNPFQSEGKIGSKTFASNMFNNTGAYQSYPGEWEIGNSGASVARCFMGVPTTIASKDDWTAFLTQNNVEIVYELDTSSTVQLTPDEVRTILGSNSISSNCGVVSVRYRADIGLYIDKKLA